jgi:PmbA protein
MPTGRCPVVFDPRVARSFISHFLGAISGPSIARGTSFLKDRLGECIFPKGITIIDDPHRQRGLRSKPFDGEGIANCRRAIIDKGVLTTWLLDLRSSRQLGLTTTGHAARGTASPPSPAATNVWIEKGAMSPKDLIADIESGFATSGRSSPASSPPMTSNSRPAPIPQPSGSTTSPSPGVELAR